VAGVIAFLVYMLSHFNAYSRRFRRRALYVLLVIAIGPGLVVNLIVKDHWGRPRPVHVKEYGGEYRYVPPGQIGHTPDKSFVCGHCAVGYTFFVLYFLSQNHKVVYFLLTLALAWTMGFTRMTAGGHFVSDILWSGYLVFLVAWALYYGWYIQLKWWRKPEG
jgi:membrane-associated PAP2 superfamily phosphatase